MAGSLRRSAPAQGLRLFEAERNSRGGHGALLVDGDVGGGHCGVEKFVWADAGIGPGSGSELLEPSGRSSTS